MAAGIARQSDEVLGASLSACQLALPYNATVIERQERETEKRKKQAGRSQKRKPAADITEAHKCRLGAAHVHARHNGVHSEIHR